MNFIQKVLNLLHLFKLNKDKYDAAIMQEKMSYALKMYNNCESYISKLCSSKDIKKIYDHLTHFQYVDGGIQNYGWRDDASYQLKGPNVPLQKTAVVISPFGIFLDIDKIFNDKSQIIYGINTKDAFGGTRVKAGFYPKCPRLLSTWTDKSMLSIYALETSYTLDPSHVSLGEFMGTFYSIPKRMASYKSSFVHEYVHYLDNLEADILKGYNLRSLRAYYNNKYEFNAHFEQGIYELQEYFETQRRRKEPMSPIKMLNTKKNDTFDFNHFYAVVLQYSSYGLGFSDSFLAYLNGFNTRLFRVRLEKYYNYLMQKHPDFWQYDRKYYITRTK